MALQGAVDIPEEVRDSIHTYEQTFRDKVDPKVAVCLFSAAVLPGAPVDVPLRSGDFAQMIADATEAGFAPVGPIAYARHDPNVVFSDDGLCVTVSTVENEVPALMVRAGLGPGGSLVLAGTRYGRLSDGHFSPVQALLSDVEGFLAETFVYTHFRALQIGHTGPARISLRAECEASDEPLLLRSIDEESGRLTEGIRAELPHFTFDFDLDGTQDQQHTRLYEFCAQVARVFGAPDAQFVSPPHLGTDGSDRRPDVPPGASTPS